MRMWVNLISSHTSKQGLLSSFTIIQLLHLNSGYFQSLALTQTAIREYSHATNFVSYNIHPWFVGSMCLEYTAVMYFGPNTCFVQ